MSGWLKLHRAFSEWEWADEPNMVALFIHLLLTANFEDKNWKGIPVKKGQLIAGRKKMAETTGISEQGIRTCLERLKSTKEVTISSVSKYSIITITNWEKYQDTNQISNHEVTNNQPATNQQLTTPKELKKEISKEKKEDILSFSNDVKEAFNKYNILAEKIGLPKAQALTKARAGKIGQRLKSCNGLDGWKYALEQLESSPHCRGDNDRGWRADIDFVCQEKSFTKLMEGSYASKKPNGSTQENIFDELRQNL